MGTAVFILETIVVVLSLLAGLGCIGGPAVVRIALAFCALFVIPGVSLERLAFKERGSELESTCRVFVLGLAFQSIVVCLGFIPGVSYSAISSIALPLGVVVAFLALVRGRPWRMPQTDGRRSGVKELASRPSNSRAGILFVVLFALCFIIFSGRGELGWSTDSLDHVSFVRRSVDSGVLFPHDSFYREGDGVSLDPRKGLWHPILSLWMYQSQEPADRVWREVPAFIAFFAVCSFALLALELCGSVFYTALSLALFILFCGGEGAGWITKIGYSRNMAQIVLWLDLAFTLMYYRTRQSRYLIMSILAAFIGAAFHVVFALLLGAILLGIFFYVMFLPGGAAWRSSFWRSVWTQAAGIAVPILVRAGGIGARVTEIHTHMQGMLVFGPNLAAVDPGEIATKYGLVFFYALIMAPFFFLLTRRDSRRSLVFILYVVPVILVLDPLIGAFMEGRIGYLHYRILDAAPVLVLLALVVGGLCKVMIFGNAGCSGGDGRRVPFMSIRGLVNRAFALLGITLFILYPLRSAAPQLRETVRQLAGKRRAMPPEYATLFEALGKRIPAHSVIVSDPLTSYIVSAYTDHFVAVTLDQHCSPTDTSAVERLHEARNLMSPACALEASASWLEREHADYVLLNMNLAAGADFFNSVLPEGAGKAYDKFLACPSMLTEMIALDGFRLFRVRNDVIDSPREISCVAPRAAALPCSWGRGTDARPGDWNAEEPVAGAGTDVGCGIELIAVAIDNCMIQPGDTLKGHFCWMAPREVPFGFPIEAVIRIDTKFPEGKLYRRWYGKQYRRFIERRNGCFYRLTWQVRLMSGFSYPDMWEAGHAVRQDFSLPLNRSIAPGAYEVHMKVNRIRYLPVRRPSDYLRNDDSLQGVPVGMVYVRGPGEESAYGSAPGRNWNDRR